MHPDLNPGDAKTLEEEGEREKKKKEQ